MSADADFLNECFVFSAPDRAGLIARLSEWEARAAAPAPGERLLDFAAAASADYARTNATLALTASSFEELQKKLAHARERLAKPDTRRIQDKSGLYFHEEKLALDARVAFVFPGEGAQYPNMLRGLCLRYPEARAPFDEFDEACAEAADGYRPSALIFPLPAEGRAQEGDEALYGMRGAVHAVLSADFAFARLFHRCGVRPDALVGHSSGEFAAMELAGVLRFASRGDRIRFIRDGFHLMNALSADPTLPAAALITIGGIERDAIEALCRAEPDTFRLAMDNCPHQVVLACPPARAEEVEARFTEAGAICARLPFDRPYHTAWFRPALPGLRAFLRNHGLHPPETPICSCMTADYFPRDPGEIERVAVEQWASCVRFRETVLRLYADGVRVFIDAGPRGNMTAFIDDILRDRPHLTITPNRAHRSDLAQFNQAIAQLAAHGARVEPAALFRGRNARAMAAPHRTPGRAIRLASDPPVLRVGAFAIRSAPARVERAAVEAPQADAAPSERDAVMAAYLQTMERFLATQRDLMRAMFAAPAAASASTGEPPPDYPLLGSIVAHEPRRRLRARRLFDLSEDLFLRDHTLGVDVSKDDPELPALSIMPLTMSLALCAEAAQALFPEWRVIAIRDAQATRWVSMEDDRLPMMIQAERIGDSSEVRVELRDDTTADPRAAYRPPYVAATVVLAESYPPAPPAPEVPLARERPAGWTGTEIYPDRLFHLPRFQGIRRIDRWAEEGMIGRLEALSRDQLFASNAAPRFAIDGVLLDAIGSALGLWGNYVKWDGTIFLPFRVARIDFFGPPAPVGTQYALGVRLRSREGGNAVADLHAAGPDGRLYIRVSGWEDRIWNISPGLHRFMLRAFELPFSDPLPIPTALAARLPAAIELRMVRDIPFATLESSHRVWQKTLAFLALNRAERAAFKALRGTERRRSEWLVGRAAAKDAARFLLARLTGESLGSADIPIEPDERGVPLARGAWRARHPGVDLRVSIAHTETTAVAVACAADGTNGVGVDVERVRPPAPDLMEGAFAEEDRPQDDETCWRRWCAKEAVGKALGTGLLYDARDLRIAKEDPACGRVDLRLAGAWRDAFPAYKEKTISAYTFRDKNEIFALCVR